jgi:2-oxo-hept-3-ene-1,7-dioate hydratase
MNALIRTGLAGVIALCSLWAHAQCPDETAVSAYLADFQGKRVSTGFGNELSLDDAQCAKGRLIAALRSRQGTVVGYKAAFTNPALQKRFGVPSPNWGAMFGGMMVESGARLPAKYGARPLYEADFAAVVKDAGLADAKTPLAALEHISEVRPFMELADLMLEGNPSGTALISINVGFRGGALGPGVKVEPTQAFLDALADMTVVMTEDRSGKELGRVKGDVIMEHPINAAIWIAQALRKEGIELKPGDILSLGGYIPPSPVQAGTSITVRYIGLPGDPAVTVHFD